VKRLTLIALAILALADIGHAAQGDRTWFVTDTAFRAYTSRLRSTATYPRVADNLPTQYDLAMIAGLAYDQTLQHVDATGQPVNLTGSVLYAQYRTAPAPAGIVLANYSCPIVSANAGTSRIKLSAAQTAALSGTSGLWDLLHITAAGAAKYIMSGRVSVRPVATVAP